MWVREILTKKPVNDVGMIYVDNGISLKKNLLESKNLTE